LNKRGVNKQEDGLRGAREEAWFFEMHSATVCAFVGKVSCTQENHWLYVPWLTYDFLAGITD